jgi:hypothetical protein
MNPAFELLSIFRSASASGGHLCFEKIPASASAQECLLKAQDLKL